MKPARILVTCCLGDYMRSTIKCYRDNPDNRDLFIVGCDMRQMEHNWVDVDKFYHTSPCNSDDYINELLLICKIEKIDILIPCHTNELEKLALSLDLFSTIGTKVAVADASSLHLINDKIRSAAFLKYICVDMPKYMAVESADMLGTLNDKSLFDFFPNGFVVKERHNCGGRGMRVYKEQNSFNADDIDYIRGIIATDGGVLIQEYLDGKEFTVDIIADHGDVLYAVCRHNELMENGVARISTIVNDESIIEMCGLICKATRYHGNIGFDIRCSDGKPFIIDINPRLTATVSLAAAAGINLPYYGLKLALGEEVPVDCELRYGTKIVRRISDTFYDSEGNEIV